MLAQEQVSSYTVESPSHKFLTHPRSDRILMIDKGDGRPFTLCAAPDNMKWLIIRERGLNGKLYSRADAVYIVCPNCEKLTNDFGLCPSKSCYMSF